MQGVELRIGLPDEAPALARLHVALWRETYRDIAPPAAFAALDDARRLPQWQDALADPARHVLVAVRGAERLGVMAMGPPGHPIFGARGEVTQFYLTRAARGQGLGRRMMQAADAHLRAQGFAGMGVAVVRVNTGALAFYRALGGRSIGGFRDPGPLWRSQNEAVVWDAPLTGG